MTLLLKLMLTVCKGNILVYIEKNLGFKHQFVLIYRLLDEIGSSWLSIRFKHLKQSIEAQDAFKQIRIETVLEPQRVYSLKTSKYGFRTKLKLGCI